MKTLEDLVMDLDPHPDWYSA